MQRLIEWLVWPVGAKWSVTVGWGVRKYKRHGIALRWVAMYLTEEEAAGTRVYSGRCGMACGYSFNT